jgi:hypothetical protein
MCINWKVLNLPTTPFRKQDGNRESIFEGGGRRKKRFSGNGRAREVAGIDGAPIHPSTTETDPTW